MAAGTCASPNDCWFAGAPMPAPRVGAFHLHWDGNALSQVIGPQGRAVRGMTAAHGQVFEIVDGADDNAPEPPRLTTPEPDPLMIHRIQAGSTTIVADPFLPTADETVSPHDRELYAIDGRDRVWAAGGLSQSNTPVDGLERARPWIATSAQGGPFEMRQLDPARFPIAVRPVDIAAQPGADRAWIALQFDPDLRSPTLVEVDASGAILQTARLPEPTDPDPGAALASSSSPTALACAAPSDCWLGTADGWLFHTAQAPQQPVDETFRSGPC